MENEMYWSGISSFIVQQGGHRSWRPLFPQGWMDVHSIEGSGAAWFSIQGHWWQIPFTTMMLDTTTLSIATFQIKGICIICSHRKHGLNERDRCTQQCHHHSSTQHVQWHPLAWHVPWLLKKQTWFGCVMSECTALLSQKSGLGGVSDSSFSSCAAPTYYCGSEYFLVSVHKFRT